MTSKFHPSSSCFHFSQIDNYGHLQLFQTCCFFYDCFSSLLPDHIVLDQTLTAVKKYQAKHGFWIEIKNNNLVNKKK